MNNMLAISTLKVKEIMLNHILGDKWKKMSKTFPPYTMSMTVNGSPYIHALIFTSENDRLIAEKKINKFFIEELKINYPLVYDRETLTLEMINKININKGDFACLSIHN